MAARLQNKHDTAANWTTNHPTLLAGEIGYEQDTGKFKIGDGVTVWTSLAYAGAAAETDPVVAAQIGLIKSNGTTISAITDSSADWNTAYTDRMKWDGGSTGLTAATGRTSLGLSSADSPTFADITDSGLTALRMVYSNVDKKLVSFPQSGFSAHNNNVSQTTDPIAGTLKKVAFSIELFDLGGEFDNATNYRFTPSSNGYYLYTARLTILDLSTGQSGNLQMTKNGTTTIQDIFAFGITGQAVSDIALGIVYLTTSDYLEIFSISSQASRTIYGAPSYTYFQLVRLPL